jgi:hypothetical protein
MANLYDADGKIDWAKMLERVQLERVQKKNARLILKLKLKGKL